MKNFGIQEPCHENWAKMNPTEKGAFCQKCAKEVIDFTGKSKHEIKTTLLEEKGKSLCIRLHVDQELEMNYDFNQWQKNKHQHMRQVAMWAFIVVFGLSIVSCANERQKQSVEQFQKVAREMVDTPETIQEVPSSNNTDIRLGKTRIPDSAQKTPQKQTRLDCVLPNDFENEATIMGDYMVEVKEIRTLGGVMVSSPNFIEYLEETQIETATEYDEMGIELPREFDAIAYPNPTRNNIKLELKIAEDGKCQVAVYSMQGQLVQDLGTRDYRRGTYLLDLSLENEKPGVYLVTILSENFKESLQIVRQ